MILEVKSQIAEVTAPVLTIKIEGFHFCNLTSYF